jgi:hypothetical protein
VAAPTSQREISKEFAHLLEHVPVGARDQYKTKAHGYERTFVYPRTFAHPQISILDITAGIGSDAFQDLLIKDVLFVNKADITTVTPLPNGVWKLVAGYYVPDIATFLLQLFKSSAQSHDHTCTVLSHEGRDSLDIFGPFVKELSCPSELGLDYINHEQLSFLTHAVPNLESLSIPINVNEKNNTIGLLARFNQLKHLKTNMGTSQGSFSPEFVREYTYIQFSNFKNLTHLETAELGEGYQNQCALLPYLKTLPKLSTLVLPELSPTDGDCLNHFPSLTKLDLTCCHPPFKVFSLCAKLSELTIRQSMTNPNMAGLAKCKQLKKLDIRGSKRVTHDFCDILTNQLKGLTLSCDHGKPDDSTQCSQTIASI